VRKLHHPRGKFSTTTSREDPTKNGIVGILEQENVIILKVPRENTTMGL
jgi:hypothetical protein